MLFVVHHNRKRQFFLLGLLLDGVDDPFAVTFGRVNAEDRQSLGRIRLVPTPVPGVVAYAIDSAKGIKMQGNHFSLELRERERLGIDPNFRVGQLWGFERHFPQV